MSDHGPAGADETREGADVTSPARRWLARFTAGTTTAGLVLLGAPVVLGSALTDPARTPRSAAVPDLAPVSHKAKHPHRKIKLYRVKPGDTPAGIATRYHAWTAQLIAINHTSMLHPGQVVRIPVVVKRARACTKHRNHFTGYLADNKPGNDRDDKHRGGKHDKTPKHPHRPHSHPHPDHGWVHAHASRAEVRRLVVKRANHHGVNPDLALAIAWMESGWQQKRISSAGAVGVMQVMPATGRWMSGYVGRKLHLRNLHDNVTAGVVLIKLLREDAGVRYTVAGYYQGLAGVRRFGMYDSTKRYVATVLALKKRIAKGWNPA